MTTELSVNTDMLPRGARLLCAVSGGRDSMCLLHWLWTRREKLGVEVCVAHYDHSLRGAESDSDREFVQGWCSGRGIVCVSEKGNVRAYSEANGMSIEDAARKLRYGFLRRTAEKLRCDRIVTAHNADDNAETVLLNLMRGSGLKGLSGIPPERDGIVRPLLSVTRDEINAYAAENGVAFVEDSSNESDDYTRNRLRHHVMPALRAIEPHFSETVYRATGLLAKDEECLGAMAEDFIEQNFADKSLPCDKLLALPEAVSARVIRRLCGRGAGANHVQAVLRLAHAEGLAYADLPGMRVRHERGRLYFGDKTQRLGEYEIVPGERLCADGFEIISELTDHHGGKENNVLYFNFAAIRGKISLTPRRDGDKLRLAGRGCTKSLKALFAERGMTLAERDMTPVFRDEAGVIGVWGFGVAERCAAKKGETILKVAINKIC